MTIESPRETDWIAVVIAIVASAADAAAGEVSDEIDVDTVVLPAPA